MRDPRIRQTLNQISDNIDSVTDSARTGCFTFTKSYIEPCLATLSSCTPSPRDACPCCYADGNTFSRSRRRGTAENSFEFYNSDYYEGDDSGSRDFLGWGNDELDRLLAGSGAHGGSRSSRRGGLRNDPMYYTAKGHRRRGSALPKDGGADPTAIPKSSPFGFRWPWSKTRPTLRYKPSAADLQDHPGGYGGVGGTFRVDDEEGDEEEIESLLDSPMSPTEDTERRRQKQRRGRSGTVSSNDTTDTFRSRTDLIPSEDEDDAVPLDDEFADAFGFVTSPAGARKSRKLRRTKTNETTSTNGRRSVSTNRSGSGGHKTPLNGEFVLEQDSQEPEEDLDRPIMVSIRSDEELRHEEEQARKEEEQAIQLKRQAAKSLAMQRGLSFEDRSPNERSESIASSTRVRVQSLSSPRASIAPVVLRDMHSDDMEESSPNTTTADVHSLIPTTTNIPLSTNPEDISPNPDKGELALQQDSHSSTTRPPLGIRAYTSLRLDKFIAATFSAAADLESVFTSPPSSLSPPLSSPPILTKSYSESAFNIPMQSHPQRSSTTVVDWNVNNNTSTQNTAIRIENSGDGGSNSATWTTWLPPASLEAAKSFLYKVGEEMVSNIDVNRSRGMDGDGEVGGTSGWDDEEAMVERWKETMGVLTDDEDDDDDDGEEKEEEQQHRRRGKMDESRMKFRMEEVSRR